MTDHPKKICSPYPSIYSPQKNVTAAQYIIELICQKKARLSKTDLPIQFWKLPKWQKFFRSQLRKCHILLKQYDERAIINALKNKRAYGIYSLFAPWLIDIIDEEEEILNRKDLSLKHAKCVNRKDVCKCPRQCYQQNNARSKLLQLDNE